MQTMFKLDLDLLAETVEVYKQKEAELLAVKERLLAIADAITEPEVWSGPDADTFREEMKAYLNGEFQEMIDRVSGMKEELIFAYDNGKTIKGHADALPEALEGICISQYSEEGAGGILSLNPYAVPVVLDSTKLIEEYRLETLNALSQVEEILGGLTICKVDISGDAQAIRTSCQGLENILYYRSQYEKYASDIEDFDGELARRFSQYANPEKDYTGKFRCYTEGQEVNPDRLSYLLSLNEKTITEAEKAELAAMTAALYQSGNLELVQSMTESILKKDGKRWTEGEAAFAAGLWEYYLETEDCENIQWFLEQLQCVEYGEAEDHMSGKGDYFGTEIPVTYSFDTEKGSRLLSQIDPWTQGEAYYTLNRVMYFYASETIQYYDMLPKELEASFSVEAARDEGGIIITFSIPKNSEGNIHSFTVMDLNKEVGEEGIKNLQSLGFTDDQIVNLLRDAYRDTDVEFVAELSRAKEEKDYALLFERNPEQLSYFMGNGLYDYSVVLVNEGMKCTSDGEVTEMDFTQLETFLNGLLFYSIDYLENEEQNGEGYVPLTPRVNYTQDYLGILAGNAQIRMEDDFEKIYESYKDKFELGEYASSFDKNSRLYGLYLGLCHQNEEFSSQPSMVYPHIEKLILGNYGEDTNPNIHYSGFTYTYDIYPEGSSTGMLKTSISMLEPLGNANYELRNEYYKAVLEAKQSVPKAVGNFALEALYLAVPEYKRIVTYWSLGNDLIESLKKQGLSEEEIWDQVNATQDGVGNVLDYLEKENAGKVINGVYEFSSGVKEVYESYQKADEAEKKVLALLFQDGIVQSVSNEDGADKWKLAEGIYNSNTAAKYAMLYQEGISFLLDNQEQVTSISGEIVDSDYLVERLTGNLYQGYSQEEKRDVLMVVLAGKPYSADSTLTMKDLTPAQINDCFEVLGEMDILIKEKPIKRFTNFDINNNKLNEESEE